METVLIKPELQAWARQSMARVGRREAERNTSTRKRLLVMHLDGVPRSVLEEAIAGGRMPFLSRLLQTGTFHLDSAFWGTPASTPSFQAGLLYGHRHPNLPAYHWYDRELGEVIRMNSPKQALSIERRMGERARGSLLEEGGTAYLSLFRADAVNDLSMPSLAHVRKMAGALREQLRGLGGVQRQRAVDYLRSLFVDTFGQGVDAVKWVRQVRDHRHELQFLLNRFFITRLAWSLAENRALIDMIRGVPAIYLVFANFDEVAHRRGPFSEEAKNELRSADAAIEELYAFGRLVENPYDLVVVTDHGHVNSSPFERRAGRKVEDWLLDPAPLEVPPQILRALADGRLIPSPGPAPDEEPVVIEAGNFSHVYLSRGKEPLEALEILARHPTVLARAATHPDLGIVGVRRGEGAVALIGGGVYGPHEIESAPLAPGFSRRAVRDVLEELPRMPTAGDLVLYGQSIAPGGTVGFAWEFGSHGGLTTTETDSVVIWPASAPVDLRGLSHSTQLHQKLSEVYRH